MKVFVTGEAGYTGSYTLVQLLVAGQNIRVFDNYRNNSPIALARRHQLTNRVLAIVDADIYNAYALARAIGTFAPNAAIHFAGLKAVGKSSEIPLRYPISSVAQVAVVWREKLSIFGDDYDMHDDVGERDYVHVVDHVAAHLAAIEYAAGAEGCEAVNVSTSKDHHERIGCGLRPRLQPSDRLRNRTAPSRRRREPLRRDRRGRTTIAMANHARCRRDVRFLVALAVG